MHSIASRSAVGLAVVALVGAFATPAWAPHGPEWSKTPFDNGHHPSAASRMAAQHPPHAHCTRRHGHIICAGRH